MATRHYLDPVFHCPLMLSPIWDYCAAERAKKGLPQPNNHEMIFRLFQLSLSALSTVYQPAGKWIGKSVLLITGSIKCGLFETQPNLAKLPFGALEAVIGYLTLGLSFFTEKTIALQSMHALCHNVYDLWTKRNLDDFLEMISNALYLTTLFPFSRNRGYQCTLMFIAYRAFLSGYRMAFAAKEAYQNRELRSYKILEAGIHSVVMVSQLFRLRSDYLLVKRLKKEIEDHAIVLMKVPNGRDLVSIPIEGLEEKPVHLMSSAIDSRLDDPEAPLCNRAMRRVDRTLYDQQKRALNAFLLQQLERDKTAIKAIEEHAASAKSGDVSVIALGSNQIMRLAARMIPVEPLKPPFSYLLFTHKDGQWTLWEKA